MKANIITLVIVLAGVVFISFHANLIAWTPLKVAGAALAGASIAMLSVARLQLGAAFSVRAKAQKLVTNGIYSKIRNPIYVFGALFILGVAIVLNNWILLIVDILIVPIQIIRARNEERVLREAFGDEYDRYKAQTWF